MVAKSCTMQDGRNQASGMFCTASLLSCAGNPCGGDHNPYYFISLRCICRKYVYIYMRKMYSIKYHSIVDITHKSSCTSKCKVSLSIANNYRKNQCNELMASYGPMIEKNTAMEIPCSANCPWAVSVWWVWSLDRREHFWQIRKLRNGGRSDWSDAKHPSGS